MYTLDALKEQLEVYAEQYDDDELDVYDHLDDLDHAFYGGKARGKCIMAKETLHFIRMMEEEEKYKGEPD